MFLNFPTFRVFAASFVLSGALFAAPTLIPPAHAQSTQPSPAGQASDYNAKELMDYVLASRDIQRIGQSYETRIQSTQSDEELKKLSDQRMDEMVNAVESRGLTADEYNQIFRASQADPELADEINTITNQVLGQ